MDINIVICLCEIEKEWKHKLIAIETSKNVSDKTIDFLIYTNHYVLIKKLHVYSAKHVFQNLYGRCLISYSSRNVLMRYEQIVNIKKKQLLKHQLNLKHIGKTIFKRILYIID